MNPKFLFGTLITLPFVPIMIYQGIKIRQRVPELGEATGNIGYVNQDAESDFHLLVLGESTMAGVGVKTHEEGFGGTLAKELARKLQVNVNWEVCAKSGFRAKDVAKEIIPQITMKRPNLIVIGLGGNDSFKVTTPKKWKKDILHLIKKLQNKYPNTPIAFCNMPPIKEFPAFTPLIKFSIGNLVEIHGQELKKVIAPLPNVFFNDEVLTFKKWINKLNIKAKPSDFFSDGVHPSKLTYQTWAKDFSEYLYSTIYQNKTQAI